MRAKSDHKIQFKWVDDSKEELLDVLNPSYIYKIGDKIDISYYVFGGDKKEVEMKNVFVEVTDITHEIVESILYEQIVTAHIKKV